MPRIALAALLLVVALSAWVEVPTSRGRPGPGDEALLQGGWQITSVFRDGEPDSSEVGGSITFWSDQLAFMPQVVRVAEPTARAAPINAALG
jgi:hypothetical protein